MGNFGTALLANSEPSRGFWMPPAVSTLASSTDRLFFFIYWLCVFFFIAIVGVTVFFMVKYRRKRPDQKTSAIAGHHRLEVIWSVGPGILLVVMFLWGFRDWMNINVPPSESLEVQVLGQKWSWSFDYPKLGITGVNELVVPKGRSVKLTMSSVDVLHSFYIPAFRIKRDVIPNRYTVLWFESTREGTYNVFCTEYCGNGHSRMATRVKVVSEKEFQQWTDRGGLPAGITGAKLGEFLFKMKGCTACHSVTTERNGLPGPPLGKKFGQKENLSDGTTVLIDENYIRESVMKPNAKVVAGYAPVMPTFAGQLKDREINALVSYIKGLR